MLWVFPELSRFMELLSFGRVHTWMRKFGHALPKPTVLYSNVESSLLGPIKKAWSKRMESQWLAMLKEKLLAHPGARRLLRKRAQCPG